MKKPYLVISLSRREVYGGFAYLAFQILLLPVLLVEGNEMLTRPLSEARLNFAFFAINYLSIFLIFRRMISISADRIWMHHGRFWKYALLGLLGYAVCTKGYTTLVSLFYPGFVNANDESIFLMAGQDFSLMILGTVLLVPMVEECLYRGLIFGRIYPRSRVTAYIVSMAAFSLIHVLGYAGYVPALDLLLSFVQYLPAGFFLAWAYASTGTVFAPVLIHALVNAYGIFGMR